VAKATMALKALVTKVAAAIKVTMKKTVVPAFPATTIERAIGRIAVSSAVAGSIRTSGQEETDAN